MSTTTSFDALLEEMRPKLHRYCARLVGSVIDGEDAVQEALAKAVSAYSPTDGVQNRQAWLFRIAHNVALDMLRRRAREERIMTDADYDASIDPQAEFDAHETAELSLRTFMRLPFVQRSAVLLMDVLGYSLREIGEIMNASIPAVKSALSRGRTRLREIARELQDAPAPALREPERSLLNAYVDRFNARDFDAIRKMIADEVNLEVVNETRFHGKLEAGTYFVNYTRRKGWHFSAGLVEGRPAALVRFEGDPPGMISYFVLLEWEIGRITGIRDFIHAQYAADGAEYIEL